MSKLQSEFIHKTLLPFRWLSTDRRSANAVLEANEAKCKKRKSPSCYVWRQEQGRAASLIKKLKQNYEKKPNGIGLS